MIQCSINTIVATLGIVFALVGASTDIPYSFWIGVAGLAFAAAGNAITKYSGNAIFTFFGIGVAALSAVVPSIASVNEKWGRLGLLLATVLAAVGKGIFGFNPDPPNEG
ncbi:MAG: hypothetical protein U0Y68_20670 [Blastocatellia bacterium]